MMEQFFWELIEEAWVLTAPELAKQRQEIAYASEEMKENTELGLQLADAVNNGIQEYLSDKLKTMAQSELRYFDAILAQKLYDIDRADIQQFTDGSDDGFLYARGFIVGMGEEYYNKVHRNPRMASANLEAESFCYFAWQLHEELYGAYPENDISRETGSNAKGWKGA